MPRENQQVALWPPDLPQFSAAATMIITPGDLLELQGSGDKATVRRHATAGGAGEALFACTATYVGKGIEDAYALGEYVPYVAAMPGARIQARIKVGVTVAIGSRLESDGAGRLQLATTGVVLAVAEEQQDNQGPPADTGLVTVRITAN